MTSLKYTLFSMVVGLTFFSDSAMAYIDPGSGSVVMSAIVGFLVAAGIAVKTYWYKLKTFFVSSKQRD